jgi:hypothetical protein
LSYTFSFTSSFTLSPGSAQKGPAANVRSRISDWLRNRNTVEFLGVWESVYNPNFNYGEFAIIKSQAGLNSYKISVKDWVEKTKAVGLKATAGKGAGAYGLHFNRSGDSPEKPLRCSAAGAPLANGCAFC